MRGMASFIAGFGNGYFKAEDKKYERERQQKLDAQANELHTAKMSEILAAQDERQRERDFREANVAALSAGKTDTGQVVTDAAGSNAYTKDADAAAVLQDMAQTMNGGAQTAPATRVLTGAQGATQRGTIPGQQVFTDPAKAQEFAQSMPMTEYAKLKERQRVAEQYGKLEIADDMRTKLENLAQKGVFKAGSLLDAGNADGALKVLQDMNPDLVPKGAQFKQVDVPDMFDRTKTAKGWALVAPGAEGQPERVLVGDFRDAVFGYLTPQERIGQTNKLQELELKRRELEEVKIPNAETQRELLSIKTAIAQMRASGGGSGGRGSAAAGGDTPSFDPYEGFDPKNAQSAATQLVDDAIVQGGKPVTPQERARLISDQVFKLRDAYAAENRNRHVAATVGAELRAARSDPAAYAKSYSEALQVMDAKTLEGMGFKAPAGTKQGAAPAPSARQGAEGSPATPKVLATMGGNTSKSKDQELQEAYQAWQAAKTPWFAQRTPTSEAREREAEARYTELLRNQYQK